MLNTKKRHTRAASAYSRDDAEREQHTRSQRRLTLERLREVIHDVGRQTGREGGAQSAFADALDVTPRLVNAWYNDRALPAADNLRLIQQRCGVSVDWLLGADVPKMLEDRAAIGAVAEELRAALLDPSHRPWAPSDETERVRRAPAMALVRHVVGAWWQYRALAQRRRWYSRLMRLATLLEHDASLPQHAAVRLGMRTAATDARKEALNVWPQSYGGPDALPGHDVYFVEFSDGALTALRRAGERDRRGHRLKTEFNVMANGFGFAYRGEKVDHAWFLNATGEPVHRSDGRFLVERKRP